MSAAALAATSTKDVQGVGGGEAARTPRTPPPAHASPSSMHWTDISDPDDGCRVSRQSSPPLEVVKILALPPPSATTTHLCASKHDIWLK